MAKQLFYPWAKQEMRASDEDSCSFTKTGLALAKQNLTVGLNREGEGF